jgi:hypothetical protein
MSRPSSGLKSEPNKKRAEFAACFMLVSSLAYSSSPLLSEPQFLPKKNIIL